MVDLSESQKKYLGSVQQAWREELVDSLLPFWERALDTAHGGVFTCFSNDGKTRVSTDKYVWSQGRFVFVCARLVRMVHEGSLSGIDTELYSSHVKKTVSFLLENAFLSDGTCAFLLTEDGTKKEPIPGQGLATSVYADCFVLAGLTEYSAVFQDSSVTERAVALFDSIDRRISLGTAVRSAPYDAPPGFRPYGYDMFMVILSCDLAKLLESLSHGELSRIVKRCEEYVDTVLSHHDPVSGRAYEMNIIDPSSQVLKDTLLYNHVTPGHTLESLWFLQHACDYLSKWTAERKEWFAKATLFSWNIGWDEQRGGLFRFVGAQPRKTEENGDPEPTGRLIGDPYEELIQGTWDTKLWWVHSEALYTLALLAMHIPTHRDKLLSMYKKTHEYTFGTFPNPDKSIGEWIQILERSGNPSEKQVALPVKDPFHIIRNAQLMLQLLHEWL